MKSILTLFLLVISLYSQTIKDITNIVGIRENQLLGYGLLVGLPGTGDKSKFTMQSLQNLLRNAYIKVDGINSKNIAAVMVTASLPPFARQGDRLKLKISSIGDAKSIDGGQLLITQLKGVDGKVYALAQGTVTANKNIKTTGYIYDGAIVENEIDYNLNGENDIVLSLIQQSATTAALIEEKINKEFGQNLAYAYDTRTIKVAKPKDLSMIRFISKIQNIRLNSDIKHKIVIDSQKGIILAGADIIIKPITIQRDGFTIRIKKSNLTDRQWADPAKNIGQDIGDDVKLGKNTPKINLDNVLLNSKEQPTVSDLIRAMKVMKVDINEIIDTIKMLNKLGAIDADIELVR